MKPKNFSSLAIMVMALALGLSNCNGMETIDPIFDITSASSITFTSAAGPQTLTLTSNAKWNVKSSANWLTLSSTTGSGDATITVTATANTTGATRTATLTFTINGLPNVIINVSQPAQTAVTSPSIVVEATGLDNLRVDQEVNASITYTLTDGTYASSITAANFAVSGLPAGLLAATAQRTNNTVVTIAISGKPSTAKTTTTAITRPSSIPAINVSGASSAVSVSGTLTAGVIVSATDPGITIAATGLNDLQVGKDVDAHITYTLTNGTYASSITAANFAVSGLPAGLTAVTAQRTNNTVVTIAIKGQPTTATNRGIRIVRPSNIPATNVSGAGSDVPVSGSVTISRIAPAGLSITVATMGLNNLKVNQDIEDALIIYTLTGGIYANSITAKDFAPLILPSWLKIDEVKRSSSTVVTITLKGKPTAATTINEDINLPDNISAQNVFGASSAIPVLGTAAIGAIARGTGAEVNAAPTSKTVTSTSIEVNPVTITTNPGSQVVEYNISNSSINPSSTWQTSTVFSGLTPSSYYYVRARSKENKHYEAGAIKRSARITTLAAVVQTITASATGLSSLKVNEDVNATITYTIANGTYSSSITPANFAVTDLPPGLKAAAATRASNTTVTITISGKPSAYKSTVTDITLPANIPATNITEAAGPVTPTGTVRASAVAKGTGAEVNAAPTFKSLLATSIVVNTVTIGTNPGGQVVEYSLSASSANPSFTWQTSTTFSGLSPSTQYYVWARAQSNGNYDSGAAKVSVASNTSANNTTKTVTVGTQQEIAWAGDHNGNTFPVRTNGIANGVQGQIRFTDDEGYAISTFGETISVSTVQNNYATITVITPPTGPGYTYYFTVTIDGVKSEVKSLPIVPRGAKTVTIGDWTNYNPLAGGTLEFPITTTGIANGATGTGFITDASGGSVGYTLYTVTVSAVQNNRATATFRRNSGSILAGTYYFKVTIDGVTSNVKVFIY
jgi:hypothetical protein